MPDPTWLASVARMLHSFARQLNLAESFEHYPARSPQNTILYKVVQENLESFIKEAELENPSGLPEYVRKEFYEYLQ